MDPKEKKQLAKQRKENAKQAQKYHKEQEKQNKKSSEAGVKSDESKGKSKIKDAVSRRRAKRRLDSDENLSREEKFRREGEEKIRNLQPQDYEEGYFIDEYAEKQRQEKRAKEIRKQEKEVISRSKKPMTRKQIRLKRILISSGIFAAVIIMALGAVNLILDPFHSDDLVNYILALLCMAAVVWVCIEMLILHNRECSNPMPQFESHTGGEGNA